MHDHSFKKKIRDTGYLVEADDEHYMGIWYRWAEQSPSRDIRGTRGSYDFRQVNPGFMPTIGELDGRPIVVSLSWSYVGDMLVCFYHGCSQLVDHQMIEEFLDETFPNTPRTDAANFHHVLQAVDQRAAG